MNFHVAVIPDGNRRWAKMHGLPVIAGHKKGGEVLGQLVEKIIELKIDCFTFWGASMTNLTKRPSEEINFLDKLFADQFRALAKSQIIHQHQIRVRVLGFWSSFLSEEAQQNIKEAVKTTAMHKRGMLNFLIAYDGIEEMLQVFQMVADEAKKDSSFIVSREMIKRQLLTKDLPPVDLLIRTGGEPHLSAGFMMWDIADAQMVFLKKLWPEFTPEDLEEAVADFQGRERRFGA
ncbi:MAG: polyprenyl diphosphate synthase [Patescibacteria group bacterium]